MGIFVSSQADLIAMINVASGLTFTAGDLIFGTPRAATQTEITQFGKNTSIAVQAAPGSTKVAGFTKFFYDRLDLKPLENFDLTNTICGEGLSTAVTTPIVTSYLNIPFTVAHLVDHISVLSAGKVNVQLEATADSLGWTGSATLKFGGYPDIATAFNDNKLLGF